MPKVDYAAIEERDFSAVENGIYEARLTNWELITPKQGEMNAKGKQKQPYYNLEFTAEEEAGIGNRKFWLISSLDPGALWRFKKDMIALGANPEDMAPGSEVDTDEIVAAQMEGRCRLLLKQETYKSNKTGKDEVRSAVDDVLPPLAF